MRQYIDLLAAFYKLVTIYSMHIHTLLYGRARGVRSCVCAQHGGCCHQFNITLPSFIVYFAFNLILSFSVLLGECASRFSFLAIRSISIVCLSFSSYIPYAHRLSLSSLLLLFCSFSLFPLCLTLKHSHCLAKKKIFSVALFWAISNLISLSLAVLLF